MNIQMNELYGIGICDSLYMCQIINVYLCICVFVVIIFLGQC
jgi:hypothetical protein